VSGAGDDNGHTVGMTDRRRVILITGASRGIGRATALQAARAGYAVGVNSRRDGDAADEVVAACRDLGVESGSLPADVADEQQVVGMFDAVESSLGPLDVLVNNAGVLEQQMRFADMTTERWRRTYETNVIGAMLCAREAVRRMSTSTGGRGGAIVNVSSAAARLGSPGEYVDYAMTKAALDALTIGLGKEVAAEGIRVTSVRPGVIHTGIHASGGEADRVDRVAPSVPLQRGGEPDEVARAILWLAGDEASYVTAATLDVTGGR
jgi:NAD(P)-dependent dehydrogenase (short-subunit alcohol dehydrogenase family)